MNVKKQVASFTNVKNPKKTEPATSFCGPILKKQKQTLTLIMLDKLHGIIRSRPVQLPDGAIKMAETIIIILSKTIRALAMFRIVTAIFRAKRTYIHTKNILFAFFTDIYIILESPCKKMGPTKADYFTVAPIQFRIVVLFSNGGTMDQILIHYLLLRGILDLHVRTFYLH